MISDNINLDSILQDGSCAGMMALVYTPAAFHFAIVSGDDIHVFDGSTENALDLASVYEARLFGADQEIHWRRNGETGRSAVKAKTADEISLEHLLWGTVEDVSGRWSRLASSRTPGFWVPFAAAKGKSLKLTAQEMVAVGVDGNAYIAGERLTGLAVAA